MAPEAGLPVVRQSARGWKIHKISAPNAKRPPMVSALKSHDSRPGSSRSSAAMKTLPPGKLSPHAPQLSESMTIARPRCEGAGSVMPGRGRRASC